MKRTWLALALALRPTSTVGQATRRPVARENTSGHDTS